MEGLSKAGGVVGHNAFALSGPGHGVLGREPHDRLWEVPARAGVDRGLGARVLAVDEGEIAFDEVFGSPECTVNAVDIRKLGDNSHDRIPGAN